MGEPGGAPNFLASVLRAPSTGPRLPRLALEGALFTGAALLFARAAHVPESGFFAIFLASAGLTSRLDELLDENRTRIFVQKDSPWRVNSATAAGVLAMFVGVFAVFGVAALTLGAARSDFAFVREAAQLGAETITTRRFASPGALLAHNGAVLVVFAMLAFVYGSFGALLALSWNGCVWAIALAYLVRNGMASAAHPAVYAFVATIAVLPHLVLEALAYVLGALAAIFFSRALTKYPMSDPRMKSVLRAVGILAGLAVLALALAGALESTLPRALFALVTE